MSCKPDTKTTNEMYDLYQQGFSCSEVGKAFGVSRQTVFTRFGRRGLLLRKPKALPFIMFQGKKYTRRSNGYYACTKGGREFLHRTVWVSINGDIPKVYDVHHIDGDKGNNHISNLELISKSEHAVKYPGRQNQHTVSRTK